LPLQTVARSEHRRSRGGGRGRGRDRGGGRSGGRDSAQHLGDAGCSRGKRGGVRVVTEGVSVKSKGL
jgi:hypothetical protein